MPEDRLCIARQKEGTDTVPSRGQVPAQQPTSAASDGRGRYAWSLFERGNNRISRFAFTQFDLAQNSQATRLTAKPPAQVRKPAALPSSHHTRRFRDGTLVVEPAVNGRGLSSRASASRKDYRAQTAFLRLRFRTNILKLTARRGTDRSKFPMRGNPRRLRAVKGCPTSALVRSGHFTEPGRCPLFHQKQTFAHAIGT